MRWGGAWRGAAAGEPSVTGEWASVSEERRRSPPCGTNHDAHAADAPPPASVSRQPARVLVALDLPDALRAERRGRARRERPALDRALRRTLLLSRRNRLSGDGVRRRVPDRGGLSRSRRAAAHRREGLDGVAADPLSPRHHQLRADGAGAGAPVA